MKNLIVLVIYITLCSCASKSSRVINKPSSNEMDEYVKNITAQKEFASYEHKTYGKQSLTKLIFRTSNKDLNRHANSKTNNELLLSHKKCTAKVFNGKEFKVSNRHVTDYNIIRQLFNDYLIFSKLSRQKDFLKTSHSLSHKNELIMISYGSYDPYRQMMYILKNIQLKESCMKSEGWTNTSTQWN